MNRQPFLTIKKGQTRMIYRYEYQGDKCPALCRDGDRHSSGNAESFERSGWKYTGKHRCETGYKQQHGGRSRPLTLLPTHTEIFQTATGITGPLRLVWWYLFDKGPKPRKCVHHQGSRDRRRRSGNPFIFPRQRRKTFITLIPSTVNEQCRRRAVLVKRVTSRPAARLLTL